MQSYTQTSLTDGRARNICKEPCVDEIDPPRPNMVIVWPGRRLRTHMLNASMIRRGRTWIALLIYMAVRLGRPATIVDVRCWLRGCSRFSGRGYRRSINMYIYVYMYVYVFKLWGHCTKGSQTRPRPCRSAVCVRHTNAKMTLTIKLSPRQPNPHGRMPACPIQQVHRKSTG
jgi:hypothetical protein